MEDNRAAQEQMVKQAEELEKTAAVLTEYFVPQFIKECNARGITFENEQELEAALENAVTIQKVAGAQQEKQAASHQTSGIVQANEMLKQYLGS